jgi:predicted acylesterase/phospholipase RssA
MSMSLPFIYKPYVIKTPQDGFPPCGTYVDGGLWNNLPYREVSPGTMDQTLGLRLEVVAPEPVRNLGQLLGRTATFGLFGTGESQSQVIRSYGAQIITLDTCPLSLIDFDPKKPDRDAAVERAARAVYVAFGKPPPKTDTQDDIKSALRRIGSAACVGDS